MNHIFNKTPWSQVLFVEVNPYVRLTKLAVVVYPAVELATLLSYPGFNLDGFLIELGGGQVSGILESKSGV